MSISEWEDELEPEFPEDSNVSESGIALIPRPLVQVLSVRIRNINKGCNIYGTITITDGTGTQYLYNRKREEYQSIDPDNNTVLLIDPNRAISDSGMFTIHVDLMDNDRDLPLVSNGRIVWNFLENPKNVYDEPIYNDLFEGDYGDGYGPGSVRVSYMVLTAAVEAIVKVTLMIGNEEDPSHVYGRITACNSNFSEGILLFRKAWDEHIDVRPGQLIPLSRSVLAVPLNSSLIVRAGLWDYNAISYDGVIARGIAEFPTEFPGTFEELICGEGCEIRVEVTLT